VSAAKPLGGTLVLAVLLLGCGSSNGTTTTVAPAPVGPVVTGKPIPPPKPRETIGEAVKRISATISSHDCDQINRLTALSRQYDACSGLQGLAPVPVTGSASYGDGGGVIEYGSGSALRNAILIVDSDGLYHLPLVDPYNTEPSVGTKFASQFDAAARDAVKALRDGDCDAFKRVALARFGPGSTPELTCTYLAQSPLTQLVVRYPQSEPKLLGGNGDYAFYSVSSPEANFTMVMARESATGVAPGAPSLPSDAPEYGFVDAYQTNPTTTGPPPS
jgi:hypothetical protein